MLARLYKKEEIWRIICACSNTEDLALLTDVLAFIKEHFNLNEYTQFLNLIERRQFYINN